jgi:hypothetical protein
MVNRMAASSEAHPVYRPLACWLCLPSFVFLLAPVLGRSGDSGAAVALLAVLISVSVAPIFTLGALALAFTTHFTSAEHAGERRMWTLVALAIAANLLLAAGGLGVRLLH